jgi:hypothetical protein
VRRDVTGIAVLAAGLVLARPAAAEPSCREALDRLGVEHRPAARPGVADAVEVLGPLGGVTYVGYAGDPLVLDCSLVYSLARAGQFLIAFGVDRAIYSSAYQRRTIRGTNRPSRHSYGLAIDVHTVRRGDGEAWTLRDDFEQGLGDARDCVGDPLTPAGAALRAIDCAMRHSGLFRNVLDPDFDGDHYNHFHLEALPWRERDDRDADAALTAGWAAVEPARATVAPAAR